MKLKVKKYTMPELLKFENVKKIFPARYTKIRMPTDMILLMGKKGKYMTKKEIFKIKGIIDKWEGDKYELYAERRKKGVKLISFDLDD